MTGVDQATDDTTDNPTRRAIALIALLLLAGVALRGYLPAAHPRPPRSEPQGPMTVFLPAALLAICLVILTVAIINRARDPRTTAGSFSALAAGGGARTGRPRWRVLLIGAVVVTGWLALTLWVSMHVAAQHRVPLPAPGPTGGPQVVPPGANAPPTTGDHRQSGPQHDDAVLGYLVTGGLALLALIIAGVATARTGRPQPPGVVAADDPVAGVRPGESLARAAELGLAEIIDPNREPREAIIACYAVMERQLGHDPDVAPREFDTPTEVLTRAVDHHALPAENAARLVRLFTEARFSPHLMTEAQRAEAVRILRLVLDELTATA
ncbi:DUF4129 domain-containing protein [Mycobacterium sp. M1]|uniref:DUF4129 domain-containing protein n=1 Tax=Mycolicibacter acidiphilus TaxID=2835306 RepID=A0ABS5RFI2_9MYCO|nr:DUF4129 domain-containing protein [Mycolicibacter acidiphilus]MBS9532737.1 DUF4129 domain-containing protein [Mycolicibacter acidiphilus]